MKTNAIKIITLAVVVTAALGINACKKKDKAEDSPISSIPDKLVVVTNITSATPVVAYVGTLKDLSTSNYTNTKARQAAQYPFISIYNNNVFVIPNKGGDVLQKYVRANDGTLTDGGSITLPASSQSIGVVIESDTKGYCSLQNTGKIAVFNPSTMVINSYIDLTSYALGDASPDPSIIALRNGKLYVACVQTSDGYTSQHPAQVLIIDVANGNAITSVTDTRTYWAGSIDEPNSMFFDESGDMYIFCVASYGFGGATQKCGFLRMKNGETAFDSTYFFNVSDYSITGIPNNKVDYLQHMQYAGNGILYSTGNIYALASNPPNYVTDRTMGSFKVDLTNQTITKLDLPYSNGYAASVTIYEGKVLWGLATSTGVGIYSYDPTTNTASTSPIVNTQGDPSVIQAFK
jgi:hypothetical protein